MKLLPMMYGNKVKLVELLFATLKCACAKVTVNYEQI